jgi:hypothetical protein
MPSRRGEGGQFLSPRLQQGIAGRSGHSAQPHAWPRRVRLLPRNDPHPGGFGAGLQEIIRDDGRRGYHSASRHKRCAGDNGRPLRRVGGADAGWQAPFRLRVFEPAGAQVSVFSDQPLAAGNHIIRVKFDYGIGEGAIATLVVAEKQAAQGRIERMVGPLLLLEEYENKMSFPFAGTLKKFCCSARTVEAQCRGTTAAVRAIGQRNGGRPLTGKLTIKALRAGPNRGITPAGVLNQ